MNIYDGHVERGCRPGTTAACAKRWAGSRSHTSALRPARLISDVARPAAPPASTLTNHASGEQGTLLLPGGGHRATRAGCGSRVAESKKNTHTHQNKYCTMGMDFETQKENDLNPNKPEAHKQHNIIKHITPNKVWTMSLKQTKNMI